MSGNPLVALNHAIAAAMVHGPPKGIELLKALDSDPRLAKYHRLDAVRAHLLEKAGDYAAAISHYRSAATRTTSIPEQNYLMMQTARLTERIASESRSRDVS
jgi:predicted RNA polymerase sigma factor